MKKLTRFLSLTVASAMALGMFATSAFAAGDEDKGEALDVLDQEVLAPVTYETNQTPQDAVFKVTLENMSLDDVQALNNLAAVKTKNSEVVTLTPAAAYSTSSDPVEFVGMPSYEEEPYWTRKTATLDFSDVTWTKPGTYAYILKQELDTSTVKSHGITTDDSEFLYAATVARNADGEYVLTGVVVYRLTRNSEQKITKAIKVAEPDEDDEAKDEDTNKSEPSAFHFLNIAKNTDLTITNHITGTGVSDDDYCDYHITIPEGGDRLVLTEGQTFDYEIKDEDGKVVKSGKVYVDDDDNTNNNFQLKDGETITIKDVPVGMIFKIEQKTTDYTTTSEYKGTPDDGTTGPVVPTTHVGSQYILGDVANSNSYTVDGKNEAIYYNTKDVDAPTGISVDVIPYVLVLVAAACCAVLFVSKKRSTVR